MTKIAILVPTRGRPDQAKRMADSAVRTAENPENIHIRFATQEDQKLEFQHLVVPDWSTVMTWNYLAKLVYDSLPDVKLFMLGADDMVFATPGWDTALIEHYELLKEKTHVYALRDSRDHDGVPHPIVTREYMEAMGYFIPPIFTHWFADSWTVAIGKSNGVFTHLQDYLLIHDKPSDTGAGDETHNRIRRNGWHERDSYVAKTCDHFLKMEMVRLDNYLRKREAA